MSDKSLLNELYSQKNQIFNQISSLDNFRQGSFSPRYRKCGKPYCHCAQEGAKGHGPLWLVTRSVNGKTVSKTIPEDRVEKTFEQIESFHTFKDLIHQYTEINIKICDALLEEPMEASVEAKKRG
jgi:hypothetical protein